MKKILVLVACIHIALLYGMDKTDVCIRQIGKTSIGIMNGLVDQVDGKVDVIVVGNNEQWMLARRLTGNWFIGDVCISNNHIFVQDSVRDHYKPFDFSLPQSFDPSIRIYKKQIKSRLLYVVEPRMGQEKQWDDEQKKEVDDFLYITHRYYHRDKKVSCSFEFHGKDALIEAKKDLALSYKRALILGAKILADKHNKSIAFKALSTVVGFPRDCAASVAVTAITEYVKNNPETYSTIDLFVENSFDVELCKNVFLREIL